MPATVFTFLLSLFLPPLPASAPPDFGCAAAEAHAQRMARDSSYAQRTNQLNEVWGAHAGAKKVEKQAAAPPYVLPVVFHVIHDGGTENLPEADIQRSVGFLNQALANTDFYDRGTGVATQISVCLARRSPDNEATNGITRHRSPLTEHRIEADRALKELAVWPTTDYLNVYLVRSVCGYNDNCRVSGYAFSPASHGGARDGIVIEARFLAEGAAEVGLLVHELGHYLGLQHTFEGGCGNDDCRRDGDLVCDTPPDQSTVHVPCGGSVNTCTTDTDSGFTTDQPDLTDNYMDYNSLDCYSAFTPGQRERMHFFLAGQRRSLSDSQGCLEPCADPVTAALDASDLLVEVGGSLTFTDASSGAERIAWFLDDALVSTEGTLTRSFPTPGLYTIKLLAHPTNERNCAPDSLVRTVRVRCPRIEAGFTLAADSYRLGDTLRALNTTRSGELTSQWTFNGAAFGTTRDISIQDLPVGLSTLCLTESDGVCSKRFCRRLFVRPAPTDSTDLAAEEPEICLDPFVRRYGRGSSVDRFFSFAYVLPHAGGQYAAIIGRSSTGILSIDRSGDVAWAVTTRDISDGIIENLRLDADGNLIGTGEGFISHPTVPNISVSVAFAFKANTATRQMEWVSALDYSFDKLRGTDIYELGPGGDYVLSARSRAGENPRTIQGSLVQRLNRATGATVGEATTFSIQNSGTTDGFEHYGAAYVSESRRQYLYGRARLGFDFVPAVICVDSSRNVVWQQAYQSFNNHDNVVGLVANAEGQVIFTTGASVGLAREGLGVSHLDPNGNVRWSRQIELPIDFFPTTVSEATDGYLVLGTTPNRNSSNRDIHVMVRVDRNGRAEWARRYAAQQPDFTVLPLTGQKIAAYGRNIYYTGNGPTYASAQLNRLRADGSGAACLPSVSLAATTQDIAVTPLDFRVRRETLVLGSMLSEGTGDGYLLLSEDCREPCCPDTLPFRKLLPVDTVVCPGYVLRLPDDLGPVSYRWSDGSRADTLAVLASGSYGLTLSNACGDTLTDQLELSVRSRRELDLGRDTVLCQNGVLKLTAPPHFAAYEWNDLSTDATLTTDREGRFWLTATDSCGNVVTDTIRVIYDQTMRTNLGPDRAVCRGDTLRLALPDFTDHQWSRSRFLDCFDCPAVAFSPLVNTIIRVAARSAAGCFVADSLRVIVMDPVVRTVLADFDCTDGGGGRVELVGGGDPGAVRWSTGDTTVAVTGLAPGTYGVSVTTGAECQTSTELVVPEPPDIILELPEDQVVRLGDSITLRPLFASLSDSIRWRTDQGDSCVYCPTLTLQPSTTTVVTATLASAAGCPVSRSMRLIVDADEPFYVPTAFSPNGDGVNDVFRVYPGPAVVDITRFQVFDRWGVLMHRVSTTVADDATAAWRGDRKDASPAPAGVYVYLLEVLLTDGRTVTRSGAVTLVR